MPDTWAEGIADTITPIRPSQAVFITVQSGLGPKGLQSAHSGVIAGQLHIDGVEEAGCMWDRREVCEKLIRRVSVRRERCRRIFVRVTVTTALWKGSPGSCRLQRVRMQQGAYEYPLTAAEMSNTDVVSVSQFEMYKRMASSCSRLTV